MDKVEKLLAKRDELEKMCIVLEADVVVRLKSIRERVSYSSPKLAVNELKQLRSGFDSQLTAIEKLLAEIMQQVT